MDVRQLRYFLGVLEAKSFTKAADILHVAQPAIGMQVRKLEEELGVSLLVRHSRGVTATEAGTAMKRRAQAILLEVEDARQEIVEIGTQPRGRISIGMTTSVMHTIAADLVEGCRRKYPDLSLTIVEAMSRHLTEAIVEGRLDLALTYRSPEGDEVTSELLAEESLCLITPPDHPVAQASKIKMDEVMTYDFIPFSLRPSFFLAPLVKAAKARGADFRIICHTDSVAVMKELVRRRLGCGAAPYGAVRREVERGELAAVPIVEPEIRRTLFLVCTKKRETSKTLTALCDEIRLVVSEAVAAGTARWKPVADKDKASDDGQDIGDKGEA